ncbi:hypothetical protein [Corynebacterium variabile]|uniref:hypothetical protein n=1 Tax=Corynebacterium variabile TaxID=1727 RepID=UPI00093DEF22|nr:hypothetical protein [Corynebacterium variabile]
MFRSILDMGREGADPENIGPPDRRREASLGAWTLVVLVLLSTGVVAVCLGARKLTMWLFADAAGLPPN